MYQTIFVWCGHESTPNERSYAMLKAEELIEIGDRPRCCDISWAVDGAETIYFQEQFCDWTTAEWEDGTHAPHTYTTIIWALSTFTHILLGQKWSGKKPSACRRSPRWPPAGS